jgi:hypothetical protein
MDLNIEALEELIEKEKQSVQSEVSKDKEKNDV